MIHRRVSIRARYGDTEVYEHLADVRTPNDGLGRNRRLTTYMITCSHLLGLLEARLGGERLVPDPSAYVPPTAASEVRSRMSIQSPVSCWPTS